MDVHSFLDHYDLAANPFDAEEARLDPIFDRIISQRMTHPDFGKILGRVDQPSTSVVFGEKGSGKTAIRLLMSLHIDQHNRANPERRVLPVAYDDLNPLLDNLLERRNQDAQAVLDHFRLEEHQDGILSRAVTMLVDAMLAGRTDDQDAGTAKGPKQKPMKPSDQAVIDGAESPPTTQQRSSSSGQSQSSSDGSALPANPWASTEPNSHAGGPTFDSEPGQSRVRLRAGFLKKLRRMTRAKRADLAVLAALYDQPRAESTVDRFGVLRRKLGLAWRPPLKWLLFIAAVLLAAAVGLAIADAVMVPDNVPWWLLPALGASLAGAIVAAGYWSVRQIQMHMLAKKVSSEMPAIDREVSELRRMFTQLSAADLARQPLPKPAQNDQTLRDSRYQLTRRLVDLLQPLGYVGMVIMVDRVDEPTAINSDPERMRSLVWPLFDNKFLKQERIGLKLLLPIELRHRLHRESPQFFQEARLDKQNMVDPLEWSGTTLYDLCSARLKACRSGPTESQGEGNGRGELHLSDLFADDVSRDALVDALDQMHQPRDAFKFLYRVMQEHCQITPEESPDFKIARLTLDQVRKAQAQRVQEFYRGLAPA